MTTLTTNTNCIGKLRPDTVLEYVGPGANPKHVLVRHPGQRRVWGCPVTWLDGLEPERAGPELCPLCGQEVTR